jgi:hypothetical protein
MEEYHRREKSNTLTEKRGVTVLAQGSDAPARVAVIVLTSATAAL